MYIQMYEKGMANPEKRTAEAWVWLLRHRPANLGRLAMSNAPQTIATTQTL